MFQGFEPIFNKDSKILILGSFPSVISREINFYYGNKQNRFWKMLETCYCKNVGKSIESKIEFLLKHKLALWDIVKTCEIKGSLDNDLKCIETVDLNEILNFVNIDKIICNGTKSYELFKKYYPHLQAICLPSTSPTNGRFDITKWEKELN